MATLKICVHDHTYWLTDVSEIQELGSFSIPDDYDVSGGSSDEPVIAAARASGFGKWPSCFRVVDFKGQPEQGIGKVLGIDRAKGKEWWIVPSRSCFLMSDSGRTIDRF